MRTHSEPELKIDRTPKDEDLLITLEDVQRTNDITKQILFKGMSEYDHAATLNPRYQQSQ